MQKSMIAYARKIAQYQGYPYLESGLQPLEDREIDGKIYPGLHTKYQREFVELREAYANWQSQQGKNQWHVLHEAADVYYYSWQIGKQSGQPLWPVAYASVRLYLPHEWSDREIEAAADAKYGWRSERPGNKDEAYELGLIQKAVEALPHVERQKVGRPSIYGEETVRLEARIPVSMKRKIERMVQSGHVVSINRLVVDAMDAYDVYREFKYKNKDEN